MATKSVMFHLIMSVELLITVLAMEGPINISQLRFTYRKVAYLCFKCRR